MTWAGKRQLFYIFILLIFLFIVGFFVSYPYLHVAPSCFDSKQNGNEIGVDCGGSCALSCISEVEPISILWSRTFQVVPGRYNAVAYLENKNKNNAIDQIKYTFTFANENNVVISKRTGETFVPPSGRFAVFEPAIDVGGSVPVYTTFEFTENPVWTKVPQAKIDQLKFMINNINLENETTNPRMSASIKNQSLFVIPNLSVITVLYDAQGNAVSASRTYLNSLKAGESADINFTWPEPFSRPIVTKEILPMYNIFDVSFKQ
jgi:hypothetical protein